LLPPALPDDEAERLAALDALGVLYTPAEERFDRLTRLAGRILQVPIALVSLVGKDVQWFKSRYGLDAPETPREISFCGHAILGEETLVVPDASRDVRFFDNPLVTGAPAIRFYAGHPLRSAEGKKLGTLCVIDRTPRELTREDHQALQDLAAIAEGELNHARLAESHQQLIVELGELRRKALVDPLTGLWNRRAMLELLKREAAQLRRSKGWLSIMLIDIDHFKAINDAHGHASGDRVLCEVATALRRTLRTFDAVGRWGGEEFIAVLPGCSGANAVILAERLRECVEAVRVPTATGTIGTTVSVGTIAVHAPADELLDDAINAADEALYRAKRGGRNRVAVGELPTLAAALP
jgi:diguanylate cyclase (GGDEF)-like protein